MSNSNLIISPTRKHTLLNFGYVKEDVPKNMLHHSDSIYLMGMIANERKNQEPKANVKFHQDFKRK